MVDGVDEVEAAIDATCGGYIGRCTGVDVLGHALELLTFFVEGGDGEDHVGVTRFGVGGGSPVEAFAVDVDGEAVRVGGRGFEAEGDAVVDHGAGVGGGEIRHEAA